MEVIYSQTEYELKGSSVFLAGPTPRDPNVESWRPKALELFEKYGYKGSVLVPEMEGGWNREFAYGDQIEWEHKALEAADIILFWIPRDLKDMPAFTTNIEFGYWLAKDPSKIIVGYPEGAEKMNYIQYCIDEYNLGGTNSLEMIVYDLVNKA